MPVSPEVRQELAERFASSLPLSPEVTASLVGPDHELFSALAQAESECLPDMAELPAGNFFFWIVSRDSQLFHAMRLGFAETRNSLVAPFLAHQLVNSGQIGATEIREELRTRDFRLSTCVSVESHFRIATNATKTSALYAYLGLTKYLLETGHDAVFAHQNRVSERSFARAKLHTEPLSLTRNLETPSFTNPKEVDERYWPVVLPVTGQNQRLMEATAEFTPVIPKVEIDLRESRISKQTGRTPDLVESEAEQTQL